MHLLNFLFPEDEDEAAYPEMFGRVPCYPAEAKGLPEEHILKVSEVTWRKTPKNNSDLISDKNGLQILHTLSRLKNTHLFFLDIPTSYLKVSIAK